MPEEIKTNPNCSHPKVDATLLELTEFCFSKTEGTTRRLMPDRVDSLRDMLYHHRFVVMSWLLQHGAQIPGWLVIDQTHPLPGEQSVDKVQSQTELPLKGEEENES